MHMAGAVPGDSSVSGKGEQTQLHGSAHPDTRLRVKNCWISLPCMPAAGNSLLKPKNPCERSRAGRCCGSVCREGRAGCAGMRLWLILGMLSSAEHCRGIRAEFPNPLRCALEHGRGDGHTWSCPTTPHTWALQGVAG